MHDFSCKLFIRLDLCVWWWFSRELRLDISFGSTSECLFLCIFLLIIVSRRQYVTCIISCGYLIYFTSLITYFTSWVISECPSYIFSWFEYLLASFHVLVVRCYWLRPSIDTSWTVTWFDVLIDWFSSYLRTGGLFSCGICRINCLVIIPTRTFVNIEKVLDLMLPNR